MALNLAGTWMTQAHARVWSIGNYRYIILNGTPTSSNSLDDVLRVTALPGTGVGLSDITLPIGAATYDATQDRSELVTQIVSTQHNAALTWTGIALVENRPFSIAGSLRAIGYGKVAAITSGATFLDFDSTFTLDLPSDTPIMLRADSGGTVPTALLSGGQPIIAYARNISDTPGNRRFQLALTPGGVPVSLTGGVLPLVAVLGTGTLVGSEQFGVITTPADRAIRFAVPNRLGDVAADLLAND